MYGSYVHTDTSTPEDIIHRVSRPTRILFSHYEFGLTTYKDEVIATVRSTDIILQQGDANLAPHKEQVLYIKCNCL